MSQDEDDHPLCERKDERRNVRPTQVAPSPSPLFSVVSLVCTCSDGIDVIAAIEGIRAHHTQPAAGRSDALPDEGTRHKEEETSSSGVRVE